MSQYPPYTTCYTCTVCLQQFTSFEVCQEHISDHVQDTNYFQRGHSSPGLNPSSVNYGPLTQDMPGLIGPLNPMNFSGVNRELERRNFPGSGSHHVRMNPNVASCNNQPLKNTTTGLLQLSQRLESVYHGDHRGPSLLNLSKRLGNFGQVADEHRTLTDVNVNVNLPLMENMDTCASNPFDVVIKEEITDTYSANPSEIIVDNDPISTSAISGNPEPRTTKSPVFSQPIHPQPAISDHIAENSHSQQTDVSFKNGDNDDNDGEEDDDDDGDTIVAHDTDNDSESNHSDSLNLVMTVEDDTDPFPSIPELWNCRVCRTDLDSGPDFREHMQRNHPEMKTMKSLAVVIERCTINKTKFEEKSKRTEAEKKKEKVIEKKREMTKAKRKQLETKNISEAKMKKEKEYEEKKTKQNSPRKKVPRKVVLREKTPSSVKRKNPRKRSVEEPVRQKRKYVRRDKSLPPPVKKAPGSWNRNRKPCYKLVDVIDDVQQIILGCNECGCVFDSVLGVKEHITKEHPGIGTNRFTDLAPYARKRVKAQGVPVPLPSGHGNDDFVQEVLVDDNFQAVGDEDDGDDDDNDGYYDDDFNKDIVENVDDEEQIDNDDSADWTVEAKESKGKSNQMPRMKLKIKNLKQISAQTKIQNRKQSSASLRIKKSSDILKRARKTRSANQLEQLHRNVKTDFKLMKVVETNPLCILGCNKCGEIFDSEKKVSGHIAVLHKDTNTTQFTDIGSVIRNFKRDCNTVVITDQHASDGKPDSLATASQSLKHLDSDTDVEDNASVASTSGTNLAVVNNNDDDGPGKCTFRELVRMSIGPENKQPLEVFSLDDAGGVSVSDPIRSKPRYTLEHGQIYCYDCGHAVVSKRSMQKHWTTYHKPADLIFKCLVCGKIMKRALNLAKHKEVHTSDKPFSCLKCSAHYSDENQLLVHTRVHESDTRFVCPMPACGRSFDKSSNLNRHILTHTGEKPHKCSECGEGFADKVSVLKHMTKHTGVLPLTCTYCHKGFAHTGALNFHVKTIHGNIMGKKSFICEICGLMFVQKRKLADHVQTHEIEKQFQCPCGKNFNSKDALVAHLYKASCKVGMADVERGTRAFEQSYMDVRNANLFQQMRDAEEGRVSQSIVNL